MKRSPLAALTAILAALFMLGTAAPALAHDALKSSSPAKGAEVKSLDEVKLEFTAGVRMPFVIVRGKGDAQVQRGKPEVDGKVVTQKVEESLPSGAYTIAYRVVSSDGHPIEGEIPFRLEAPEEPSPAPSAGETPSVSETPSAGETPAGGETAGGETAGPPLASTAAGDPQAAPAASAPAASGPAADQAAASEDVTFPVWLIIVIGALVGIGIGFLLSGRRKKP